MFEVAPLRPLPQPPLTDRQVVSVLLASYNHAADVEQAITSVLGQTYHDFELIIWDDGSQDTSCKIIQGCVERDARIELMQPNRGRTG